MSKYNKYLIAMAGAAVVIVGRAFGLDSWQYLDLVTLATALGVYAVPNVA